MLFFENTSRHHKLKKRDTLFHHVKYGGAKQKSMHMDTDDLSREAYRAIDRISDNIAKVKQIPVSKRHFDF